VRFINYVKSVLDSEVGATRLSDLLDAAIPGTEQNRVIIQHLLQFHRLLWYDKKKGLFIDEPVEQAIIDQFLRKAKNRTIKGYKSGRSLVVDV
jgi:hypothetical protein